MFLEPTIFSLIIGKLRKGKFENLEHIYIKGWYLLIISGILQIGIGTLKAYNLDLWNIFIKKYFIYFHLLTYLLLFIVVFLNIKRFSMKVFLIGITLNFLVIFSNGGKMPVSIEGINGINNPSIDIEISDFDIKHKGFTKDTKLPYLADIIPIPPPYPLPKIISIGDIFLMGGVFIFFQESMIKREKSQV